MDIPYIPCIVFVRQTVVFNILLLIATVHKIYTEEIRDCGFDND